jgi:hypothetical protein
LVAMVNKLYTLHARASRHCGPSLTVCWTGGHE